MIWSLVDQLPDESAALQLLGIFEKLLKKYARLLGTEDAYEELRLFFFELLDQLKEKGICADSDGYIVNYISKSVRHQYITLSKARNTRKEHLFSDISEEQMFFIEQLAASDDKQYHANLVVDGYWGPKTKAACPVVCGGSGAIQYLIQAGLYCISGFTSLTVNGEFTTDTINAAKTFQSRKNLSPADGCIGPDTFAALFG